ncbi:MAG: cation:proton antiporter [Woeseiaceae bacterium]|nr:cation:proton antiporter [Woeseiaceae bacterium]
MGLPPLVGFLGAGFAINYFGPYLGLPSETGEILDHVAHLGVLMLLFTVGLKLKLRQIVQPQVIGGALLHFAISVAIFAPGIHFLDRARLGHVAVACHSARLFVYGTRGKAPRGTP